MSLSNSTYVHIGLTTSGSFSNSSTSFYKQSIKDKLPTHKDYFKVINQLKLKTYQYN